MRSGIEIYNAARNLIVPSRFDAGGVFVDGVHAFEQEVRQLNTLFDGKA